MAELLAANQITIAKVLDGENGADGEMSAEQIAQLNQASEDASQAKSDASTAKSDVANLEIGGRNLFLNTSEAISNNNYLITNYKYANEPLIEGEIYTATICVTPAENVISIALFFGEGAKWVARFETNGTEKQIISKTFTMSYLDGRTPDINPRYGYADLFRFPNDGTVTGNTTVHWFKIEKGNKATDWSPAPEDVDANIQQSVDNLEIGGRNLFLNTGEVISNSNYNIAEYKHSNEPLVAGETYTATICITPAENVSEIRVYFSLGYISPVRFSISGTSKQIISKTFTMAYYDGRTPDVNPSYGYALLYRFPNDGTVTGNTTIHWFKIEKGNKPTDWTPAPEPTEALLKRVVIDNDSVDIVDSTGRLLASYGDAKIELGKNAVSSIIEMCGGMARVSARYGGLTSLHSNNGSLNTTLDYDFNETTFKSKVGSNYGSYEFIYSGGVWECSYSGNSAGYVQVSLSDYGITLKTTSVNEYAGILINYWNGSEATFINADTTKPSRKLIFGLAESGTTDNTDYVNFEIERSKESDGEHSKINLLTVHDGANFAGVHLDNGDIELNSSGEVLINQYNIVQLLLDVLCGADMETLTVTAGTFNNAGCTAILAGNTLHLHISAKAKSAITAGNITNQTMLTITFTDSRISSLYPISSSGGASGPNSQIQFNTSSSGGQHTITVILAAIAQNLASGGTISADVALPCLLDLDAY